MTNSSAGQSKERWRGWEAAHANLIVDSVNALRDDQGLTIRDLVVRLDEFGWPVGVATLNGILSGRKRTSFSVGEVYAFASALQVPPAYLLLGMPYASELSMSPSAELPMPLVDAYDWLTGNQSDGPFDSLRNYNRFLRTVVWQNALQHVFPNFDAAKLDREFAGPVISGVLLREAIWDLMEVRAEFVRSGGKLESLPLPEALLAFEKDWSKAQDAELPIVGLSSDVEIQRARSYVRESLPRRAMETDGEH
ncbi:helix-turn-helix transcriptional regulator [Arthrobacter sp. 260]|uniref:helix-turn-helix domain-containing protein n=1 Tax=Arthrobacter sp. 260 TaxID=2735314 RepID=UPI001492FDFF|nr:helix-turn-helix transcriptional regulator [Arthrobacter sp. 260]NOJ59736.1 helix-turn-helix transcriptional regulator [Arthrobacter sp. 260]